MVDIVAAGHLCVDIIPTIPQAAATSDAFLAPGRLTETGPLALSTGGSVSNTGLALHRLGVDVRLAARVADDRIGALIRDLLCDRDPRLVDGLSVARGEASSYTIVIIPPGGERTFLHYPGTNDAFGPDDLSDALLRETRILHLGYPPLMRRMYHDGGIELATIMRRAKASGATTSLDLAMPDPVGPSGRVDWRAVLARTLPYVDLFVPSVEELLMMLDQERFAALSAGEEGDDLLSRLGPEQIGALAEDALGLGARIVLLKLGHRGLYLRTGPLGDADDLGRGAPADLYAWSSRELWAPAFVVEVVSTNGAGDAAVAGFLASVLRGGRPSDAVTWSAAAVACNVEAADATSGVRTWAETEQRMACGWDRRPLTIAAPGWTWDARAQVWHGPHDERGPAGGAS